MATNPIYKYVLGNSPKLPIERAAEMNQFTLETLKVETELLQDEPIIIIVTDKRLNAMTISKIEHAILNQQEV